MSIEVTTKLVYRTVRNADALTTRVTLIWHIERLHGRHVRRTLLDADTGDVIDDVWIDNRGKVRSYSRPKPSQSPHRRQPVGIEAVEAPAPGADLDVVEDGCDDGTLSRQRQPAPPLTQTRSVADMFIKDADAT